MSSGIAGVNKNRLYLIGRKVGYTSTVDGQIFTSYTGGSISKAMECGLIEDEYVCP